MDCDEFWLKLASCITICTNCPAANSCKASSDSDWDLEECAKSLKIEYYRGNK